MSEDTGRLVGGRYRLGDVLGRGGMGTVWRGHDEILGRTVAVKELRFPSSVEEEEKQRLITRTLREAKAIARIRSGSAITVFDVVDEDDRPWIVMELIEGTSLAEHILHNGPLEPRRAAEVGLALLDVLRAAHREGILHRDVKPSNVLLEEGTQRVVLTDFGIAKVEGDPSVTSTGMLVGAPSYISPERARGKPPGPPADLWSLGGLLFAAVEGRPPYDKGSAITTLTAVMTEPVPPTERAAELTEVIQGLLVKDPEQRLGVDEARALLEPVAHGLTGGAKGAAASGRSAEASEGADGSAASPAADADQGDGGEQPTARGGGARSIGGAGERLRGAWKSVRGMRAAGAGAAGAGSAGGGTGASGAAAGSGAGAGSGTAGADRAGAAADAGGGRAHATPTGSANGAAAGSATGAADSRDSQGSTGSAGAGASNGSAGAGGSGESGASGESGSSAESTRVGTPATGSAAAGSGATGSGRSGDSTGSGDAGGSGGVGGTKAAALPAASAATGPGASGSGATGSGASGGGPRPAGGSQGGAGPEPVGAITSLRDLRELPELRRRVSRRTLAVVAAVVAAVIALGAVIATAASGGGGETAEGGSSASGGGDSDRAADGEGGGSDGEDGKGEEDAKDSEPPKESKKPELPSIPDDFRKKVDDRFNFRMAMPENFKRTGIAGANSGAKYARSGDGYPRVQVDFNGKPTDDAAAAWRSQESAVRGASTEYRRVNLKQVEWRDYPTVADWQFTRKEGGEKVRVLNRGFKVDGERGYAIMITCKAKDWKKEECRKLRQTALRTFSPR